MSVTLSKDLAPDALASCCRSERIATVSVDEEQDWNPEMVKGIDEIATGFVYEHALSHESGLLALLCSWIEAL